MLPPEPAPVIVEPAPVSNPEPNPFADSVLDLSLPADKQMEQRTLLNLVPDGSETHRAINNGSWDDARTWRNGIIPSEGSRVYIPANVNVLIDSEIEEEIWTVRVDGGLRFSETRDTRLTVDTLAILNSGSLTIGTKANPIRNNVTTEIIFADDSRALNDPRSLSLGLVSIGEVNIHGQEKRSHLKVSRDPVRGDRTITLDEVPSGWRVGDSIVLTATKHRDRDESEDEELIITAINGNTITLDKELQYDHTTPRNDLKAYVANLTRNVIFQSAVPDNISQRGHISFLHNSNVDVRYAQFLELGRTDKSRTVGTSDNPNGRYALHLHRQGVELNNNPAIIVGNSVQGSPGVTGAAGRHCSNSAATGDDRTVGLPQHALSRDWQHFFLPRDSPGKNRGYPHGRSIQGAP